MCNSKLYHIHVNKLVQNVFFDFVKINALHMLIQICIKFKMVYAYFPRLCHFMPMSDLIAILKSEISKFSIPILAIQKKNLCIVHQESSTPLGKVLHTSPNFYTCIFLTI